MFKFWTLNYKNLQQPLCCMSEGILWFVFLIFISYLEYFSCLLIIIFLSAIFILFQILRKQNAA